MTPKPIITTTLLTLATRLRPLAPPAVADAVEALAGDYARGEVDELGVLHALDTLIAQQKQPVHS